MACGVDGRGSGVRRHGRFGYVGAGLSAVAMVLKTVASGQADAKATRMRVALSMTRAAILSSRRRSVANSAVASAVALGISCWMRHISQNAAVEMDTTATSPPVAATVLVSLWQHGLVGLRLTRSINWKMARPSAVLYTTVAYT